MLHMVPKWAINVVLSDGQRISIWISDNFIENVLRQLANIAFTNDPHVQVTDMTIRECKLPDQQGVSIV